MRLQILTKVTDATPLVINEQGFGVVKARVAKDGVQPYMGYEVDYDTFGNTIINVYRSPAQVGAQASLDTFKHATLTNDHPYEDVSLANWGDVAEGEMSTDAELVDGYVEVTIYIKGKDAIAAILSGKQELSLGYTCIYDLTGGITPDGTPFDAEQLDIRVNHIALVEKGRAGMMCRIVTDEDSVEGTHFVCARPQADAGLPVLPLYVKQKDKLMTDKTPMLVKVNDTQITLDAIEAQKLQTAVDALQATHVNAVKELTTAHDTAIGLVNAELVKANDTIAELQKEAPTRDSIRAELTECTAIRDTAKSLGLEIKVADTDTPRSLKTAFIAHKMGDKNTITEDSADETVNSVFDALTNGVTAKPARDLDGVTLATKVTDADSTQLGNLVSAHKSVKG